MFVSDAALPGRCRKAGIGGDLAAVGELPIERLRPENGGELAPMPFKASSSVTGPGAASSPAGVVAAASRASCEASTDLIVSVALRPI
ncbi:hypothetical protein ACM41_05435 [Bradyrhizobium sp. CCBAU 21362]|nr:hypothetical protein [Bradyrhizobium sp. CCBAU 21362]